MMKKDAKIYIAGHRGLVGSAMARALEGKGHSRIITRTRSELDLLDAVAVADFFASQKPDYVFLAAARVGGIYANNVYPAEFIHQNLQIQNNVIHQAYLHKVKRLLFLGSSCIYPKHCPQPMKEEHLLGGPLEPTNAPYAVAKIAGIKMCEAYNRQYGTRFLAVMPTNLYGPNDNFDLDHSHVLPALIRTYQQARTAGKDEVVVWGTGAPRREFLHVDDMAEACLFVMNLDDKTIVDTFLRYPKPCFVNVGCGEDVTIRQLAQLIGELVGFGGKTIFDSGRPDGTLRKLLDNARMVSLGWSPRIGLKKGLKSTYDWYCRDNSFCLK